MANGILHTRFQARPGWELLASWGEAAIERHALAEFEAYYTLETVGAVLRWEGAVLHVEAWMVKANALQAEVRDYLRTDRTLREIAAVMTDYDNEVDGG